MQHQGRMCTNGCASSVHKLSSLHASASAHKSYRAVSAGTYLEVSGTSISTALVGGVAGLVLAASGNAATSDLSEVRDALLSGADVVQGLEMSLQDGQTLVDRGRRLNAYNALAQYFFWDPLPAMMAGFDPRPSPPPSPAPSPAPPPPRVSQCHSRHCVSRWYQPTIFHPVLRPTA